MCAVVTESVVDVNVRRSGGIYLFFPETDRAMEWMDENVASESWQWLGGGLALDDGGLANNLAGGILSNALVVAFDDRLLKLG